VTLNLFTPTAAPIFSPCRRYRYTLSRSINTGGKQVLFVMLNPSTADEVQNDPTIRRCIRFAQREGGSILNVVNLFAWRSTDPGVLGEVLDPIGPDNDRHIVEAATKSSLIVCAWGVHGAFMQRGKAVQQLLADRPLYALGFTKDGAPRHPLYVKGDAPLVRMPG